MKENKPLLFINSAQTNHFKDQNQYVYDSRYHKEENYIFESQPKTDQPMKIVEIEEKIEIHPLEESFEMPQEIDKKLLNKMELLQKRAKLGRLVLVEVETKTERMEGFFLNFFDQDILIRQDLEDVSIHLKDILEINILKV